MEMTVIGMPRAGGVIEHAPQVSARENRGAGRAATHDEVHVPWKGAHVPPIAGDMNAQVMRETRIDVAIADSPQRVDRSDLHPIIDVHHRSNLRRELRSRKAHGLTEIDQAREIVLPPAGARLELSAVLLLIRTKIGEIRLNLRRERDGILHAFRQAIRRGGGLVSAVETENG